MTRQTATPLTRLPMSTTNRQARWLIKQVETGEIDINPPYQRGAVWTEDQRVALMRSLLTGIPVQSLIINDRHGSWWTDTVTYDRHNSGGVASYVVVDGKQRLLCVAAWFNNELAIPASWLTAEEVLHTEDTPDGPYVRANGLTDLGRRMTGERIQLSVSEGQIGSLREEAAVYLLVNGGGTPQTDADMANAARVAEGN
ncbi:DUF262 domain-containing protein [Micromonospora echinospora]|uniref:DUF262 domain-containing protein n=1 Tax=Micromonospora echinospora TaxID=1877 RepID=UPI0037A5B6F8